MAAETKDKKTPQDFSQETDDKDFQQGVAFRKEQERQQAAADVKQNWKPTQTPPPETGVPSEEAEPGYGWSEDERMKSGTRDEAQEQEEQPQEQRRSLRQRYEDIKKKYKNAKEAKKKIQDLKKGKKAIKGLGKDFEKRTAQKTAQTAARTGARAGLRAAETGIRGAAVAGSAETFGLTLVILAGLEALLHPKKSLKIIIFIIIGFIAIMLLVVNMMMLLLSVQFRDQLQERPTLLTISKTGTPESGRIGETIVYTLTIEYPEAFQEITIRDRIPDHLTFTASNQVVSYDPSSKTVTWKASENNITAFPLTHTFTITTVRTGNAPGVVNYAEGEAVPADSGTPAEGYVPPAPPTSCGGRYLVYLRRNYLLGTNFGDPACSYSKDKQHALLKQLDPRFADLWFFTITPGESGYNPNAWASPTAPGQGDLDKCGAWGLYQMGSSMKRVRDQFGRIIDYICTPGLTPNPPDEDTWGKNGILDRNDINWEMQTSNAIQYNRNLNCNFRYWATARGVWDKYTCP